MSIDVVDLRNFYAQRLGVVARRFVGRGIRKRFADTRCMSVLGVGYPTPYLGLFREEAERCLAFMPAGRGAGGRRCRSRGSRAAGSCARPSPGSVRARRSLRRSQACTSSRRRSRSIVPFPPAASARGWCLHWSLRSCLHPVGSCRCWVRADGPCNHERAFRSVAQTMRVDLGARATRLLVARRRSGSPVTAATLHVRPRAAMSAAAAVQRETVGLVVVAVLALLGTRMRLVLLSAGDEGRQPVDVAFGWRVALRRARGVGLAPLVLRGGLCVARG